MGTSALDEVTNEHVLECFTSEDPRLQKEAKEIGSDFLARQSREDIIANAVLPPDDVTVPELDPQVDIDAPTKLFEKEPWTPPAMSIPFGSESNAMEIIGSKSLVVFKKIVTPHLRQDKWLLEMYDNDVRKILTDNLLYEIGEEIDRAFFAMACEAMVGPNVNLDVTGGYPLWRTISGDLTRNLWAEMLKILPRCDSRFRTNTVVMNQVLALDLLKWDGDEMSQAMLEELNRRGWVADEFMGVKLVVTKKTNIVQEDEIYLFAGADKLGKNYVLDDVTMFPNAEGSILEWWSECVQGMTVQPIGCGKVTIT